MTASVHQGQEQAHSAFTVSSRKIVASGSDVYVKEFVLAPQEDVPWHSHTEVFDIFYCLQGTLVVQSADVFSGERHPDVTVAVGQSTRIDAGQAHRPYNPGPDVCRFLLVQGVGAYDYLPYDAKAPGA